MAAYQCLNCHQIERGIDNCCEKPDRFCMNDMPSEILRLRALVQEVVIALKQSQRHGVGGWSDLIRRLEQ